MKRAGDSVYIIGEAGVNHNGSFEMAMKLIDVAKGAGADCVKFQTFTPEKVISRIAPKAEYQTQTTGRGESQLEMVRKLKLSRADHFKLQDRCREVGIDFLSSPFDEDAADFLTREMDLPLIKIPSGEITNAPYLLRIARAKKLMILSTGMSDLAEIEQALGVLAFGLISTAESKPSLEVFRGAYRSADGRRALQEKVSVLHCVTEYPAPHSEVNLRAMDSIRDAFGLPVGYSDHTLGISVPTAAVARGASIIEKHFTLDRNLSGPDHRASLEPDEFRAMVRAIREVEAALGSATKAPTASELRNKPIARKSLIAARSISKGEKFSLENLTIKRPGCGISPLEFWDYLGLSASQDFAEDELIR